METVSDLSAHKVSIDSPLLDLLEYTIPNDLDKVVMSFDQITADLAQLYFDGRIKEAHRVLEQLEAFSSLEREGTEQLEQLKASLLTLKSTDLYEKIQIDYKLVCKTIEEFEHSEWSKVNHTGNSKASYILKDGIHKIKFESTIKAELFSILAIISEPDLYTLWFPLVLNLGLKKAMEVGQINRFCKLAYFVFSSPWPMAGRDMAVRAVGTDNLVEGNVVVALENITSHPKYTVPPKPDAVIRMDCLSGGLLVKPIGDSEVYFSMMYNLDPHFTYIPDWLLNWVMSFFASYVCDYLCKLAVGVGKEPGCPYQKRINEKHEFYGHLRRRADVYKKHVAGQGQEHEKKEEN